MTALPIAAFLFLAPVAVPAQTPVSKPEPVIEYSDAYQTRAKIHKIGSFAMLPLAGAEYALGTSLYNGNTGNKGAHIAVGMGISTLFAVNTVTGVMNLYESRNDPNGRTKKWVHALLMMASDAGFLATWANAPGGDGRRITTGSAVTSSRDQHRTMALTSLAVGTVGYLIMLVGK
jgi:hypothetical protein